MMINGPFGGREFWRTVRAAIGGWGPTLRLVTLLAAATVCWVLVLQYVPAAQL